MATVREGNKKALLVVDAQVGVMQPTWQAPRIIQNIRIAVEKAREQGAPVIWVQHSDDELIYGSPEWQFAPELSPAAAEVQVHKQFNSSFERTSLEEKLAKLEASHIVLAGAATNWCVRATAYGALDRGYDLTLLKDAHTTETVTFEDGVSIEAASVIHELNMAMTWLSYPGRTTNTASVEDFDFAESEDMNANGKE